MEAFAKAKQKQKLETLRQVEELKDATFAPQVNTSRFPLQNFKPIQERYKEVQQYKEQLIHNLRRKFTEKQNMTFKPELDKQTERIAVYRSGGRDLLQRINDEAAEIYSKRMQLCEEKEQRIAQECTFHPNLDNYVNEEVRRSDLAAQKL